MSPKVKALILTLAVACSLQMSVRRARANNEISNRMVGAWKGEGKAFGAASRVELKWEPALANSFLRITYRVETTSSTNQLQVFEGHGYYKSLGDGKYQATWFDSQGAVHPINATFENDTLTANWGTEQTTMGRTSYRLIDATTMEIVDHVKSKDGGWKEFARAILKKKV